MKKKLLFIVSNALLVLVLGLIIGLVFGKHIFTHPAGIGAFVCMLLTLTIPSAIYFLSPRITLGSKIVTTIFVILEFILNLVFLIRPDFGPTIFWIIQGSLIGIYLVSIMIIVALFRD